MFMVYSTAEGMGKHESPVIPPKTQKCDPVSFDIQTNLAESFRNSVYDGAPSFPLISGFFISRAKARRLFLSIRAHCSVHSNLLVKSGVFLKQYA